MDAVTEGRGRQHRAKGIGGREPSLVSEGRVQLQEVLYTDRVGADGVPHTPRPPGGCVVGRGPSGKFIFYFLILLFFSVYIFSFFKKKKIFLNPFI
jgi:hypothetical protein